MSRLVAGTQAKYTVVDADYLDNEAGVREGVIVEAANTEDPNLVAITGISGAGDLDEPHIVDSRQLQVLP